VDYRLTNSGKLPLRFTVGIELNFSIGETQAAKGLDCAQVRRWIFKDSWRGLEIVLTSDFAARLMTAAIETVSGSEMGLEKTYQQLAVLLQKEIVLEPGQTKSYRVGLEIG
ncbi:MAG: alpha-amylase/4-alpha-glucanotransferase domain-containing protein, partial [Candidatus Omnitrophota bacterium]